MFQVTYPMFEATEWEAVQTIYPHISQIISGVNQINTWLGVFSHVSLPLISFNPSSLVRQTPV